MHKVTDNRYLNGHRIMILMVLCLFGLCLVQAMAPSVKKKKQRPKGDRVYLLHADELSYDQFGQKPGAQIVKGKVSFKQGNSHLTCDSAYFFQASNSVKAFGHVKFRQGDTLSLACDRAEYDGMAQRMMARQHVVLRHRTQVLKTDSLDYDRLYNIANFFEGGTLIDGKDRLVADWGEYHADTRDAAFYYNVKLRNGKSLITTDTLLYDLAKGKAHILGPSKINSGKSIANTKDAYYYTKSDQAQLYGRSTLEDGDKSIIGDSLYYRKDGNSRGFGNVIYTDHKNKNQLLCNYLQYNEKTGYGFATKNPVIVDFSQKDTLWVHADSMKIYTYNINTDSVYRKVHAFRKVRAFRNDIQAVCDSLVFNSKDSCATMYKDPIAWSGSRQLLGEQIKVFMNDSTIKEAQVIGQALGVELMPDGIHFNQITSKFMKAYFVDGNIKQGDAISNVTAIYYPVNDKDTTLIGLNYLETDTMKMYMSPMRKMQKIWTPKAKGTLYPMTQIPPSKTKLPNFAWFPDIRPLDKNDIFVWRGKGNDNELKTIKRHDAPLQHISTKEKEIKNE